MQDEFYIGWQDQAPRQTARLLRSVIWSVAIVFPLVGGLLVLNQRGFLASHFEITQLRDRSGILEIHPIPCLKIPHRNDFTGEVTLQRILLVGIGKKSAQPILQALEARLGQPLAGRGIQLRGKLIYYAGLEALELAPVAEQPGVFTQQKAPPLRPVQVGSAKLYGEILDPKCYLGVMRPGEGKPHRSCAIRCLLGGIPVFFKTSPTQGRSQYLFVLDERGQPLNQQIAPFVADEVRLVGQVERWDNWWIIKTSYEKGFCRINPHWAKGRAVSLCE